MTLPPTDSLEGLSLAQLRGLVAALIGEVRGLQGQVERLETENQALRAENQTLKDEIAWLKNVPPRPPWLEQRRQTYLWPGARRSLPALTSVSGKPGR